MRGRVEHATAPAETWERRQGAACAPLPRYRRREPEKTILHAVVRERIEPFLAAARDRSPSGRGLPAHVERDLRAYLDCGILARGFARVRCPDCGFERLVAFSCKARTCPSCNARRMEDVADHLVHDVFPAVPVRQWVLSFPRRLRFLAARDSTVASRLLDLFTRAVFAWQRRKARRLGVADPRTAGVTAVQRFGSAINLNVHYAECPVMRSCPAWRVKKPVSRGLQAAEVDRRLRFPEPFKSPRHSVSLDGFSLHAGIRIQANDLQGRERLWRYAVRPPFALNRLSSSGEAASSTG
jgi:hypothetical protein